MQDDQDPERIRYIVLKRKLNEAIDLGDGTITVTVKRIGESSVSLCVAAAESIPVRRKELLANDSILPGSQSAESETDRGDRHGPQRKPENGSSGADVDSAGRRKPVRSNPQR